MSFDRVIKWLLPREDHFYSMLEQGADCVRSAASLMRKCCEEPSYERRRAVIAEIDAVESRSDRMITDVYTALNKTFVTPIDRSDIYALASKLEAVVDRIFATVLQIDVHAMEDLPDGSIELSHELDGAGAIIEAAVKMLRDLKNPFPIRARCKEIGEAESRGDHIYRTKIGQMFATETNAIRLLKHKEFLEGLEQALDACDDVANALESIAIKNA